MTTIDCSVKGCTCSRPAAAHLELLVHTDDGRDAVCLHHRDAARPDIEPFYCPIPQQRQASE